MTTVFSPARLGPITLRNRVIKAATFEGRTPDALVTDDLIAYHRAPAAGGVGMTTVAYCAVSPEGRTDRHQIWMRPEAVPGLRRLTEAIHAEGAAASAQIGHAGPVANAASNRLPALAPGRMFSPLGMARTVRPDAAELQRVVRAFADAARTAEESGFDAVELHFGHNYLISSFFSPLLNRRRDDYGGSLANRARLAREVAEAVREAVGGRIAVLAKLNMDDGVVGGLRLEESLQIGRWLEQDGALDALELTIGSSLLNPMYLFHGEAPRKDFAKAFPGVMSWGMRLGGRFFLREYPYREAYMLDLARQFRYELKMPLVLLGGITTAETMQRAMDEGFEFVAMARALLRQPDLLLRIQQDANTPSLCTHCNKCMPSIFSRTTCVLAGPDQLVAR
ncbi:NADH:flavin oxidoreductase [Nocardia cyriacigeorgica]|uniref:NADPH dehydrogenase n=1 Tax=Nocardia cyriacigeorgica TaxID=135487 RepID=A0A4U8VZG7_9NOCA|nr:NADH:flavin oxidoreductase [Nocardia cyriacigeorgica]MBF6158849.1 NADH:flavin oxidoreductase [Nocardia cyriacigeorgica]MBF6197465.1 NADH:flavin oxidoreductase [Nocardia cyriacigeorgica]MBF6319139.1 NADH:flavin oxidoreductase [Nocardia cyriacigeorgica]MBF6345134.1 NADH:flavin oxidoreductase [Nocardia cyriacigeorgica]MBF6531350.1 NADH:flavin oxidoreductase [Nocardia cyriacigeorgica]